MALRVLTYLITIGCLILSNHSFGASKENDRKSYIWQDLERNLQIKKTFSDLAHSLDGPDKSQNIAQVSLRCRQIINTCSSHASALDLELAQLIVASCAFSGQPSAMGLMEQVLNLSHPYPASSWLCAMQYLASQPDSKACDLLIRCLGMPYVEINMAAAYFLSENPYARSNPKTISQILSLQRRLDRQSWIWIVDFLTRFDHPQASQAIRQIYFEADVETQAAILQILADSPLAIDELAANALTSSSPQLQEAVLYYALLHPSTHAPWFNKCLELSESRHSNVATAANFLKIAHFNEEKAIHEIQKKIEQSDIHAIAGCSLLAKLCSDGLDKRLQHALVSQLEQNDDSTIQLNAALSLLECLNGACLTPLAPLLSDPSMILASSYRGNSCWPTYQLQAVPDSTSNAYPFALMQQYHGRRWLLEKANRMPINLLQPWYEKIVMSDEGSSHYLISSSLSDMASPRAIEILQDWKEAPGKPWLRLGCALSLWRIHRDKESLEKLQNWVERDNSSMLSYLTSAIRHDPLMSGQTWVADFETQVLLQIASELCQSNDPLSWQKLCLRIANNAHPLTNLPLIALMSRYL